MKANPELAESYWQKGADDARAGRPKNTLRHLAVSNVGHVNYRRSEGYNSGYQFATDEMHRDKTAATKLKKVECLLSPDGKQCFFPGMETQPTVAPYMAHWMTGWQRLRP